MTWYFLTILRHFGKKSEISKVLLLAVRGWKMSPYEANHVPKNCLWLLPRQLATSKLGIKWKRKKRRFKWGQSWLRAMNGRYRCDPSKFCKISDKNIQIWPFKKYCQNIFSVKLDLYVIALISSFALIPLSWQNYYFWSHQKQKNLGVSIFLVWQFLKIASLEPLFSQKNCFKSELHWPNYENMDLFLSFEYSYGQI